VERAAGSAGAAGTLLSIGEVRTRSSHLFRVLAVGVHDSVGVVCRRRFLSGFAFGLRKVWMSIKRLGVVPPSAAQAAIF
jgi:hypothetical protein